QRGVKIHVMARPPHTLKEDKLVEGVGGLRIMDDVGIKVHKLKHLKLHAKMLLADGVAAIVGSINLAPASLDDRRELAIEVREASRAKGKEQTRRSAALWSASWIGLALLFGLGIHALYGADAAVSYLTAYVLEKSLSIDNIFVFVLIFSQLRTPAAQQRKVLY